MFVLDFSIILLLIIFAVCSIITTIIYKRKKGKHRLGYYWFVEAYLIVLLKIAIMPIYLLSKDAYADFTQGIKGLALYGLQLIPFKTINDILEIKAFPGLIQIVGNLLLLMPIAFIVVWIMNKTNKMLVVLLGLVVSILIEFIQLIINLITAFPCHAVDIDDVILNYFGYLLATLSIWLIKKYFRSFFDKVRSVFVKEENENGR